MSVYLTDLAGWLRDAGVTVLEYDGWQTRARSSGGYAEGRPWCCMWHHTASRADPADDAAYCAEGSPDAPLCNVLIDRAGVAWILAAGATNTNGKGYAMPFTRGTVPDDSMNTYAVGLELANDGVGEVYPGGQIDAAFRVSVTITERLGLAPTDVGTHQAYAPDRKIDPATADAATAFWPRAVTSSGTWHLEDLRAECAARAGHLPPPRPPMEDDDMTITAVLDPDGSGRVWIGDGMTRHVLPSMGVFSNYVVLGNAGCYRFVNASGEQVREIGHVYQVGADTLEALGRAV